jgi:hypothetical protein
LIGGARSLVLGPNLRFGAISAAVMAGLVGACLVMLFKPEWMATVWRYFDATVLQKLGSDSGIERMQWNARAWAGFIETYGLGVGAGSARGSGWPVVLLGNTGALGTMLFLVFFLWVMLVPPRGSAETRLTLNLALRAALVGVMMAAAVSGTMIDLGLLFYLLAAGTVGLALPATTPGDDRIPASSYRRRPRRSAAVPT